MNTEAKVVNLCRNSFILLISGIFLIGQWGCVTSPLPPSLEETYRQKLGRIGVVTARFVPNAELTMPHPSFLKKIGQEAAEGAKSGASRALERGGGGGHPGFIVFWVLAAPIVGAVLGGLGGAVYGAFTTPDVPQSIQDSENLLKQKLAKLRMQETIQ